MTELLFALVPLTGAVVYSSLLLSVHRRAQYSHGLLQFELMLGLLVISSVISVAWRLTNDKEIWSDILLRVLTCTDMWIAPTLLMFVATRYRNPSSRPAILAAWVVATGIGFVGLSGAVNRAILQPGPSISLSDQVLSYLAVAAAMLTYLASAWFLHRVYRQERDPFERNRLKYLFLATLLVISGQLTNLFPALHQYPVDRGLAIIAAFVIFFSLIRYRLFDVDLAVKRAVVSLGPAMIVTPIYLLIVSRLSAAGSAPWSPTLLLGGTILAVPAILVFHILRSHLQNLMSRLFLGQSFDLDAAATNFIMKARAIRGTDELADLIANVCQAHFEARFTTVLLQDTLGEHFDTVSTQGPFASLRQPTRLSAENPLLRRVGISPEAVTPVQLRRMVEEVNGSGLEDFGSLDSCLIQPITTRGTMIGLIAIGEHLYDDAYSLEDLSLLNTIGVQAGLMIEGARLFEQVQRQADTDFLTGLPNHRRLKDLLAQCLDETASAEGVCSIAMVDVDNFKMLNDTHGHIAGDDGLKTIAQYLRAAVRQDDIVARYGGDEFMLILPGVPEDEAISMMTTIARDARRVALHTADGPWSAAPTIPMRLSWGVATYPTSGTTDRLLVAAADSDLMQRRYVRGRAGRVSVNQSPARRLVDSDPRRVRIASGLLDLLDAKDRYTTEHSQQVASLGLLVAEELRLSEKDREYLWLGGLLHDIGKLNVPDEVLRKPGALSISDWEVMHQHPIHGARLADSLFADPRLSEIVGCHHERWDGQGYPAGLCGTDIPFLARAVSVCDAYSAMVHDRPYRKGLAPEAAIAELRHGAGSYWDPEMVMAFERAMSVSRSETQPV